MSELSELYQEVILDHNKTPRNFGKLETANRKAEGSNPLCGDKLTVFLELEGDRIVDISFVGSGCAISTASASIMTETLKGKRLEEAQRLFGDFHALVTGREAPGSGSLGKLAVFHGVSEFPVRVKCATLAWHTFQAALEDREEPVSTE